MREQTTESRLSRADMVDVRRAIINGWPMSEEKRRAIIVELQRVIDDPGRSERDREKASETLTLLTKRAL